MNEFLDELINNALVIIGNLCIAALIGIAVMMLISGWILFFKLVLKTNREEHIRQLREPEVEEPFSEFNNTEDKEEEE